MLFIVYEFAACLVAALIGGTFLFTASALCVVLWEAGGMTWRRWRERAWVPRGSDNEETMIPEEVSANLPLRTVNSRVTATAVPMTRQIPRFARTCQALPQGASMRRKSCAPCSRRTWEVAFLRQHV